MTQDPFFSNTAGLSAPGYLDCTPWSVFETEEEAEQYLAEMFGDDEEESE